MFVCDVPAKSFILKIKGHSGFFSCTRCIQEGEYCEKRVCFPYSELKCLERTHNAYINMAYEEHHIGLTTSRLVELPGIDLVHTFPLDYMQCILCTLCVLVLFVNSYYFGYIKNLCILVSLGLLLKN